MSKHRKAQPVTRREVLRIVQAARDEILSAIVHAEPELFRLVEKSGTNGRHFDGLQGVHLADVEPVEAADG